MKKSIVLLFLLVSFFNCCLAETKPIKHVIYVTLDGVRWQDIVQTKKYFPLLWQHYAPKMTIYGEPNSGRSMETASVPISLPSYQSQMTGAIQPCEENDCGQVKVETMPENLLSKLKLKKYQVAVFASWKEIGDSIESIRNNVYSNVGNLPVVDPITNKADAEMARINQLQKLKQHIEINRVDEYTFAQSLHYFKKHKPVFLWISLLNADNEAHDNHLQQYHDVLTSYDQYLNTLFTTLKEMKLDQNTLVIITTDHGRGNGDNWTTHGPEFPESKRSWAFVMNGSLTPVAYADKVPAYSTLSIRPTIEKALGVM